MEIFLIIVIIATSFGLGHAVGYYRGYGMWGDRLTEIEELHKKARDMLNYLRGVTK